MSHLYFNEESYYSEENTCQNEVFCSTIEQKISIGANARSSHWRCSAKKKRFYKTLQNSQEALVPKGTSMNFAKFLRTIFLQNNFEGLLLKCGHCNNEVRDIARLYLLQRARMQCVLLWLKCQSAREASHHPAFMEICATNSHTYQSYLPDI